MTGAAEPAGGVLDFPFSAGAQLELEPGFREAQERPGLTRVQLAYGKPAWLATRMEDVRQVLTDQRMSRALAFDDGVARSTPLHPLTTGLLALDEPEHRRLRRLIADDFSREAIALRAAGIGELTSRQWAAFTAAPPPGDLVSGFALEIASVVIADILGVSQELRNDFRYYADCVVSTSALPVAEMQERREGLNRFMEAAMSAAAKNSTGLLGRLARPAPGDDGPPPDSVGLATAVLVAGFETTANQITNFVYLLLDRPDLVAQIQRDPGRIPALVEELLRLVPLGVGGTFPRVASEDLEIGGQPVRRGETVIASLGAANQDPRAFECPREVQPGRPGQHVAMGRGPHFCLGTHLAKTELAAALRAAFAEGPPPLAIAADPPPRWREGRAFRGFASLHVVW